MRDYVEITGPIAVAFVIILLPLGCMKGCLEYTKLNHQAVKLENEQCIKSGQKDCFCKYEQDKLSRIKEVLK